MPGRSIAVTSSPAANGRFGKKLSPVVLVIGELHDERPLTVADGYHRICASYHLDPDALVPCQIVDLPD